MKYFVCFFTFVRLKCRKVVFYMSNKYTLYNFWIRLRPHVYVFKSTPFSKVSVFARPHDNAAFSNVSTFKPVFESLRFLWKRRLSKTLNKRLRVDGRRKRTEKCPFSHENVNYKISKFWNVNYIFLKLLTCFCCYYFFSALEFSAGLLDLF